MNPTWNAESGRLACRWSGALDRNRYNATWLQEPSKGSGDNAVVPVPNFAAHSPLGSGEWFVPWNRRWSVPSR
jgi:hypothetical protein